MSDLEAANLAIWSQVKQTDLAYTKQVTIGSYSFTAIDAYYQLENCTRIFGPLGMGWGYQHEYVTWPSLDAPENLLCYLTFWYKWQGERAEFRVTGTTKLYMEKHGKTVLDSDAWKKSLTDALTKALSYLGFNADVFQGAYDGNKYVAAQHAAQEAQDKRERNSGGQRGRNQEKADTGQPGGQQQGMEAYEVTLEEARDATADQVASWRRGHLVAAANVMMADCGWGSTAATDHLKQKHGIGRLGDLNRNHALNLYRKALKLYWAFITLSKEADAAQVVDHIRGRYVDVFELTPGSLHSEAVDFRKQRDKAAGEHPESEPAPAVTPEAGAESEPPTPEDSSDDIPY